MDIFVPDKIYFTILSNPVSYNSSRICSPAKVIQVLPDSDESRKSVSKRYSLCLLPATQTPTGLLITVCISKINNFIYISNILLFFSHVGNGSWEEVYIGFFIS